jgi:hypothetical protein
MKMVMRMVFPRLAMGLTVSPVSSSMTIMPIRMRMSTRKYFRGTAEDFMPLPEWNLGANPTSMLPVQMIPERIA